MDGTIVIGEGERDEAPMLYIGEKVGLHTRAPRVLFPAIDIAVDPLEGTNLCATGAPNSAMKPSPRNWLTVPPYRCTSASATWKKRSITR